MKIPSLLLLSALVGFSTVAAKRVEKRSVFDAVGGFLRGLWDKLTGNETNIFETSICPGSMEQSLTHVSDDQLTNIIKVHDKTVSNPTTRDAWGFQPPAMSQLVEAVRDDLGNSVENLTDTMLSDVLFAIKFVEKHFDYLDIIDAVKIFSFNLPALQQIFNDCGLRRIWG